jgi:methylase of polypeptide subunit release factors
VSYDRFSDLTGTDYSEGAIELAKKLATRDGLTNINFLVRKNYNTYTIIT